MKLTLIAVPYDLGRERVGSGRGPEAYLDNGAEKALRDAGNDVETTIVQRTAPFGDELEAVLDVNAALAIQVSQVVARGRLPLVLAGNCNATLGVHAGLMLAGVGGAAWGRLATVWLDAHGDFNTPQITLTGYLDGMPLAMLVGAAHRDAWETLGAAPQSAELVLHAGGRDLDPAEDRALAASGIIIVSGPEVHAHGLSATLAPALDALALRAAGSVGAAKPPVSLHVDLDVLDPGAAPGVVFPSPGGPSVDELVEAMDLVAERFTLRALSLASLQPDRDQAGATLAAGLRILQRVVAVA